MKKFCKVCGKLLDECTCKIDDQNEQIPNAEQVILAKPKFCKQCGKLLAECSCNHAAAEEKKPEPENIKSKKIKFCKVCGNPEDKCTCKKEEVSKNTIFNSDEVDSINEMSDKPVFSIKDKANVFERNKKIVPDCIVPDKDEIPVRQYEIAYMRSILKGMRAEGRLQVTNKRVLFRGAGMSLLGPVELQHEFAIDDIAGVELRRDYRIGFLNFILALILSSFIGSPVTQAFSSMMNNAYAVAVILAIVLSVIGIGAFVLLKRRLIIKLIINSVALGACAGLSFDMKWGIIPQVTGGILALLAVVVGVVYLFNLILVAFTPNLVIAIKTNSASAPIEIRRKRTGLFAVNKNEYTGFADVMPGKDFHKAKKELGTMIREINTNGEDAVNKWKEQ